MTAKRKTLDEIFDNRSFFSFTVNNEITGGKKSKLYFGLNNVFRYQ